MSLLKALLLQQNAIGIVFGWRVMEEYEVLTKNAFRKSIEDNYRLACQTDLKIDL